MRLNLSLWALAKTFYSLSLFVMIPFFLFGWIYGLNDKLNPATTEQVAKFVIQNIGYFCIGWFLLSYTPKKFQRDLLKQVDLFKQQGFKPKFEAFDQKFFNSYAGWSEAEDKFALINLDRGLAILTSKQDGLVEWHLNEKSLGMITDIKIGDQHISHAAIPVRPAQYHSLYATLMKLKRQKEVAQFHSSNLMPKGS